MYGRPAPPPPPPRPPPRHRVAARPRSFVPLPRPSLLSIALRPPWLCGAPPPLPLVALPEVGCRVGGVVGRGESVGEAEERGGAAPQAADAPGGERPTAAASLLGGRGGGEGGAGGAEAPARGKLC